MPEPTEPRPRPNPSSARADRRSVRGVGRSRDSFPSCSAQSRHVMLSSDVILHDHGSSSSSQCRERIRYTALINFNYVTDRQHRSPGPRCYDAITSLLSCLRQAHRTLHALHRPHRLAKTPLASDKIDAPAACATLSATRPFRSTSSILRGGGVVTRTRNVSEYMLVLALCLVSNY